MELKDISKKRQKKRKETDLYKVEEDTSKPKFYILDMFPYPSGSALHVGHPKGYIATDVLARKKMLQGFNVLHPMGFDTFGLGTEQYAIDHKMKPQVVAQQNIAKFVQQLEDFGMTYDRSRSVTTADPKYFKRTQRIFLQMYNHYYDEQDKKAKPIEELKLEIENWKLKIDGNIDEYLNKQRLAYVDYKPINRCPHCMTGLANEDLDDGKCERCGSEVEQKPMKQRVLRITKYADRLLSWLDDLQRDESMKDLERNRIGKSEGTEFRMKLLIPENDTENARGWKNPQKLSKENNDGTYDIIWIAIKVHKELGPWLQEKIYQKWLEKLLKKAWYKVEVEKKIQYKIDWETIWYWAIDILVNDTIAIELKSRKILEGDFYKQLRTYINQSDTINCGLLINFYNWKLDYKRLEKDYFDWKTKSLLSNSQVTSQKSSDILWNSQDDSLEFGVYTTRIDTVFWMSFVAIAPEHPLVDKITTTEYKAEVDKYKEAAKHKTQLERTELQKDKSGVFCGAYAINPFNGEKVKIFVADYVLANYGTGVVMAVPAHDERDFEFAKKYDIKITQSIAPYIECTWIDACKPWYPINKIEAATVILQHRSEDKYLFIKFINDNYWFVWWKIDAWENKIDCIKREIPEETWYTDFMIESTLLEDVYWLWYKPHKDRVDEAHEKVFLAKLLSDKNIWISEEEQKKHTAQWLTKEEIASSNLVGHHKFYRDTYIKWPAAYTEKWIVINSWEFSGLDSDKAIVEMQKWLKKKWIGGVKVNYRMQDRVFSRQRYRGEPFPVLRTEGTSDEEQGTRKIIPMDEKELPLLLPDVENYEPTGTEEWPLANITERVNVTLPDWTKAKRETNTMPGRAGSSRYWLRYMDVNNDEVLVGKDKEKYRGSVDVYVGGAEHITRHMIYGRFWQKFLFDIGAITHDEPFQEYHSVGLIMGEDGRKMSKRRGNVVNPDDIINEFGTDVLRAYEMFMGPFDQSIAWSTNGIKGIKKFLDKIINLSHKVQSPKSIKSDWPSTLPTWWPLTSSTTDKNVTKEDPAIVNQTIKKVWEDIDGFRFNTAISQLMILVNHLTECTTITKKTFEDLIVLVSPFAPHLAEELREQLGNEYSLFTKATRPSYDEKCLVADTVTIGVQVNGKVRWSICISKEAEESEVMQLAKADEKIAARIVSEPKKVIYVKGKILNIVV